MLCLQAVGGQPIIMTVACAVWGISGSLNIFHHEKDWFFFFFLSNTSASNEIVIFPSFINVIYCINFLMSNQVCISGMGPTWYIINMLLDLVCLYFAEDFCFCVH